MLINSDFDITVSRVVSANRLYNYPIEEEIHNRCRKRWAIALKYEGKTYYTSGEKQILSDSIHMVILPKGASYSWRCVEPGGCLIIEFDALQEGQEILSFPVSDNSFFMHEFHKIQENLNIPGPEARLDCIHRVYGLLLQLLKSAWKSYVPKETQLRLKPALDFISENYDIPDISNTRLAALCGISTVYFRKLFQSVYGVSPIRYLHDFRMKKAKDILSSDYGSISQVAQSTGYSSVYHFSKMFRTYNGISPSQYAKASRQK